MVHPLVPVSSISKNSNTESRVAPLLVIHAVHGVNQKPPAQCLSDFRRLCVLEPTMIVQNQNAVCHVDGLCHRRQVELWVTHMRVVGSNNSAALSELTHYFDCRTPTYVAGVPFVRQAPYCDLWLLDTFNGFEHHVRDVPGHEIVDRSCGWDQRRGA